MNNKELEQQEKEAINVQPDSQEPIVPVVHKNLLSNLNECDDEEEFWCTRCQEKRTSKMNYTYGTWTYLCCFFWCFLTFIGGLVPFCIKRCQDKEHVCPKCASYVGRKQFQPCKCCKL